MPITSAGLLLYRRKPDLELFLAHMGGPFWQGRDANAWSIPKGVANYDESLFDAAIREFREETGFEPRPPFIELGSVRQRASKTVFVWAFEGDVDPALATSNVMETEWPRGSGRWISFPEVDRYGWFSPQEAKRKLIAAQGEFVDRLIDRLL